jgi:CRP-like cAMP-binding protein
MLCRVGEMQSRMSLKHVKIFDGVSDAALDAIEAQARWRACGKGVEIIRHQDESNDIVFLLAGTARVNIYSGSGRVVTFRDIGAGDFVGELSAIDNAPRSAVIEALEQCQVAYLSSSAFWKILETEPSVVRAVLLYFTGQVRNLTARVYEFSTLAVRNRIHAELLRICHKDPNDCSRGIIEPAPTHAELASRVATHREAVTRELRELAKEGLLEKSGRNLIITDLDRLGTMLREVEDL